MYLIQNHPIVTGIIIYFCTVMPLIYHFGGAVRKYQNRDMKTGEPLD